MCIRDREWTNAPWLVTLDLPVKEKMVSPAEQCVAEATEIDDSVASLSSLKRKSADEEGGEVSTSAPKKVKCV